MLRLRSRRAPQTGSRLGLGGDLADATGPGRSLHDPAPIATARDQVGASVTSKAAGIALALAVASGPLALTAALATFLAQPSAPAPASAATDPGSGRTPRLSPRRRGCEC